MNEDNIKISLRKKSLDIILKSDLDDEDKKYWEKLIEISDENELIHLNIFLKEFPDEIKWLTNNIKKKIDIAKSGDLIKWNDLLKDERKEINTIIDSKELTDIKEDA
jgi:hypothetical protein